ncbi:MAG: hypothetical protein AB7N76_02470 [Planctomycetota bacterium]
MSDESLRRLERRWQETGAVDDEAALLTERARVGALDPERLRLAAYCGHPAAVLALGDAAEVGGEPLDEFLWGLFPLGERWLTVACGAAVEPVLEVAERVEGLREALALMASAVAGWVSGSLDEHVPTGDFLVQSLLFELDADVDTLEEAGDSEAWAARARVARQGEAAYSALVALLHGVSEGDYGAKVSALHHEVADALATTLPEGTPAPTSSSRAAVRELVRIALLAAALG